MTNLKKTLAVVLAFAMILSMGAISTFAYTDVAEGTVVSEAVGILSNLNILTGFEDGTFRPDETVTRAQMAAIICRTLGYEDQAQSSMGSTVFNDVAADHWASGYVNVAQAQQIINGYGDGNFGPEDKVTYEQAVKMIVSALGYDLAAQAKGGYPTGYLAIASAEGITKKANGKVGDAAARSTIAVLVYNALEVPLMDQSSWSTGSDGDKYAKQNANILTRYLDVTKVEGVLEDAPILAVAQANAFKADTIPSVSVAKMNIWKFNSSTTSPSYEKSATLWGAGKVNADKVDVNAYLGKHVVAYIAEDELTGADTVVAIVEDSAKNTVKRITGVQLADSDERYYDVDGTIGYKEVGSSRIEELDLAADAVVYTNFENKKARNVVSGVNGGDVVDAAYLGAQTSFGGTLEFISNDGDSDYDYIIVTAYDYEDVITSVEEFEGEYAFESKKNSAPDLDTTEEDGIIVVYKDGVAATPAALAANDTISVVELGTDCYMIYASSATVTGVVDSYSNDDATVSIAGTEYTISAAYGKLPASLSGEEGIYFLNVDGEIAYSDTAPTAVGKYALVTRVYDDTVVGETVPFVEAVLADGSVVSYEIKDSSKVKDADGNIQGSDVETYLKSIMQKGYGENVWYTTLTTLASKDLGGAFDKTPIVKLTIGNDKVTGLRLIEDTVGDFTSGSEFNSYSTKVGSYALDEGTVVFSVKQTATSAKDVKVDADATPDQIAVDAEDVKVGAVADFMVDDESYKGYAYDKDQKTYGVVLGLGMTQPIAVDSAALVVMSKKTTTIDDNDAYVVTGLRGGEEVTITIYNEDESEFISNPAALGYGDVILIAEPDADGIVSNIKTVLDADRVAASVTPDRASNVKAEDDIYYGYGAVTVGAEGYDFTIGGGLKREDNNTSAPVTDIDFESAANYVLVDYTESNTPEITKARGNKRLFDDSKYVSYAYVRFVDGDLAEVVAYRFDKTAVVGSVSATLSANTGAAGTVVTVTLSNISAGEKVVVGADGTTGLVVNQAVIAADGTTVTTQPTVTVAANTTKIYVKVYKNNSAGKYIEQAFSVTP